MRSEVTDMSNGDSIQKRLVICLGIFALLSNALTTYEIQYIPQDPYQFAWHLSLYSAVGAVLCVLGIVGAKIDNSALIHVFANYLLLDTFVSTLPRLLAITLVPALADSFCTLDTLDAWRQLDSDARFSSPENGVSLLDSPDVFSNGDCRLVFGIMQVFVVLFVVGATIAQLVLAMKVYGYARSLRMSQLQRPTIQAVEEGKVAVVAYGSIRVPRTASEEKMALMQKYEAAST